MEKEKRFAGKMAEDYHLLTRAYPKYGELHEILASGFTLHNFIRDYRSQVMEHIQRILVPGGLFVNADKYTLEGQAMFDELGAQLGRFFDAFVPLGKLELLRDWILHNVADQAPERAMAEKESVENMEKQGFADINVLNRHGLEAVVSAVKQA